MPQEINHSDSLQGATPGSEEFNGFEGGLHFTHLTGRGQLSPLY